MEIEVLITHKSGKKFPAKFNNYRDLIEWAQQQEQNRVEWFQNQTGGGVPKVVKREEKMKTVLRKK
jgi:hypothetical protein